MIIIFLIYLMYKRIRSKQLKLCFEYINNRNFFFRWNFRSKKCVNTFKKILIQIFRRKRCIIIYWIWIINLCNFIIFALCITYSRCFLGFDFCKIFIQTSRRKRLVYTNQCWIVNFHDFSHFTLCCTYPGCFFYFNFLFWSMIRI